MVLFLFFHLLAYTNPTLSLDAMLQAVIINLSFFRCFELLISIISSHNSNMIITFWITIIKIIMIKINIIIKGYTIKSHIIAKKCNKVRVEITKDNIIVRKYSIIKFFNHITRNKPIGTNFNASR